MKKTSLQPPLSNAVAYILLALAEHDLHGYGIMQETMRISGGEYKMGPGTLYDNLKGLIEEGLVSEVESKQDSRRFYHLTKAGAGVLTDELKRLDQVLKAGKKRLASGRTRVV